MIHQQSFQAHRFVGRLEQGEDLITTLSNLCTKHDVRGGRLSIWGALEHVEMVHFDPASKLYKTAFSGDLAAEIVHLSGTISRIGDEVVLRLHGHLMAPGPFGTQSLGGQIKNATATACEFVIDAFDDISLERGIDKNSGRAILRSIDTRAVAAPPAPAVAAPAQPPAVAPAAAAAPAPAAKPATRQASMSWADAIEEASDGPTIPKRLAQKPAPTLFEDSEEDDSEFEDSEVYEDRPELKAGDLLDHPKLGRCRVLRMDNEDRVRIKIPKGGISTLALDYFDIFPEGTEDGRLLYRLEMKAKKK